MAAPFLFFLLLVGWVSLALVGYALIVWSPAFLHGVGGGLGHAHPSPVAVRSSASSNTSNS